MKIMNSYNKLEAMELNLSRFLVKYTKYDGDMIHKNKVIADIKQLLKTMETCK